MKSFLYILLLFISFAALSQSRYTLISEANIIDVKNGKVSKGTSVLIKDGFIQELFTDKKMKLPPGTIVIDGTAKYVIPGMTDAHIHFSQSGSLYTRPDAFNFTRVVPYQKDRDLGFQNTTDYLNRYLRLGITAVADVGGPLSNFKIRDSISTKNISPTVLVTGPLFSMVDDKPLDNGEPPIVKTTTIVQADSLLNILLPLKPDYIKVWYIVTPELPAEKTFPIVQHIAKRTHAANLKLAVHATELKTAELAVDAGADILVHSVEDFVVSDQFVKKLVAKKVSYIPTLVVMSGYITAMTGQLAHHASDLFFANPFAYGSLTDPEHLIEKDLPESFKYIRSTKKYPSTKVQDSIMAINLKKVYAAGVNVVAGTDAGNIGTMHGSSFVIELEAMKRAGLTNAEILKSATLNSAVCFDQNTGLIEKGKAADLVVLMQNPLDNISNVTSVEYVVKSGRILKADTLVRETPEMLVQRQLNAYNARNLDAFLDTYSDSVELYTFPEKPMGKGKDNMRKVYGEMFKNASYLHCEVTERIRLNSTIIDHEHVKFNDRIVEAIAIYEVKDGKISKVTFKE
jgi:imidazolonepropionase-like amidohydrolase